MKKLFGRNRAELYVARVEDFPDELEFTVIGLITESGFGWLGKQHPDRLQPLNCELRIRNN